MSFYVRSKTGITWQLWETTYKSGKRNQKKVPEEAYSTLGLHPSMSLEAARRRAAELNIKNQRDHKSAVKASRRVVDIHIVKSLYVPEDLSIAFYKRLKEDNFSTEKYSKKMLSHWQYVQTMLSKLEIEPKDYNERSKAFYKYFMEKCSSIDYVRKLLRVLNLWGAFVCKQRSQFYEPVELPTGHIKQRIHEAYQNSLNFKGESDPLTPTMLEGIKDKLKVPGNYEWLYASVWFGLRPQEIDAGKFMVKHANDRQVLLVYQSKLTSIAESKRWKAIPIIYKEQETALKWLLEGKVKRPLGKTLKKYLKGHITLYGGRKGFFDLMRDRDHSLEDIASWMGHQNIQTTWAKYRSRQRIGG